MSRRNIILMGPPGAGKGTQASAISRDLKLQHLSTGDVLRREVESQSVLGKQAKDFMNRGELVADQLIIDMVASFIRQHLQKNQGNANALQGFLYDGFPRNVHQAEQLDVILKDLHEAIESVVNLEVPEKVLLDRITKRATTDSRTDDNAEVFKARLKVYEHDTKPLLDYYHRQGKLRSINGNQSRDQVAAAIAHALPKLK